MSAPELPGWRHLAAGKVRDLYEPADGAADRLLMVASDRVSAFDVVLEPEIAGKGALLTRLSDWWFDRLGLDDHRLADQSGVPAAVAGRATLVRRLDMLPVECVVRGYLTGSGFAEYRGTGAVSGVPLPPGLADFDRLPEPVFTPAFKAEAGAHDENISLERVGELVGAGTAEELRRASLAIFERAERIARERGVILADTKLEFGRDADGRLVLADEVLTSDSSRYWDAEAYAAGRRGVSFDKQIVRDWLAQHWDRTGAPPRLPPEIVERTAARYRELIERLTA